MDLMKIGTYTHELQIGNFIDNLEHTIFIDCDNENLVILDCEYNLLLSINDKMDSLDDFILHLLENAIEVDLDESTLEAIRENLEYMVLDDSQIEKFNKLFN